MGGFPLLGWRWHRYHLRFSVGMQVGDDADGCRWMLVPHGSPGGCNSPILPPKRAFFSFLVLLAEMLS